MAGGVNLSIDNVNVCVYSQELSDSISSCEKAERRISRYLNHDGAFYNKHSKMDSNCLFDKSKDLMLIEDEEEIEEDNFGSSYLEIHSSKNAEVEKTEVKEKEFSTEVLLPVEGACCAFCGENGLDSKVSVDDMQTTVDTVHFCVTSKKEIKDEDMFLIIKTLAVLNKRYGIFKIDDHQMFMRFWNGEDRNVPSFFNAIVKISLSEEDCERRFWSDFNFGGSSVHK